MFKDMIGKSYYDIIDIHAHILENVDDGSQSLDETLDLFEEAEEMGVKEIILTPHYYRGLYTEKQDVILNKYNELVRVLEENQFNVKAHIGREVYITPEISNEIISADNIYTLANSKYVLLETSFEIKQLYLEHEFARLIDHGYKPIFAHVERYNFVQKDINVLEPFLDMGVRVQCNYASILGLYGKKAKKVVTTLLKHELVDYMGSDVHRAGTIYQYLPDALGEIEKIVSPEYLEYITYYNAKRIIS